MGIYGGFVLEGAILLRDDLGFCEILLAESVNCNGALSVAQRRRVVVGAVVAPSNVVVGGGNLLGNLLGKDDVGGYREEEG